MKSILQIKKLNMHLSIQSCPHSVGTKCLLNWHLSIVQVATAAVEAFQCLLSSWQICLVSGHILERPVPETVPPFSSFTHNHCSTPSVYALISDTPQRLSVCSQGCSGPQQHGAVQKWEAEEGKRMWDVAFKESFLQKISFTGLLAILSLPHPPHYSNMALLKHIGSSFKFLDHVPPLLQRNYLAIPYSFQDQGQIPQCCIQNSS